MPLTLEDQVFGSQDGAPSRGGCPGPVQREVPPPPAPAVPCPPPPPSRMDKVTRCMAPILAGVVVVVVVLWSLRKSVQYTEVFQSNPRYQYGLWSMNVLVVLVSTAVVCYMR